VDLRSGCIISLRLRGVKRGIYGLNVRQLVELVELADCQRERVGYMGG